MLELREGEPGVGSSQADGTVNGKDLSRGVVVSGNGAPHGNPVDKSTRTVTGSVTGNLHGHVGDKGTPTMNLSAAGGIKGNGGASSTGKAPTVPSMAWIKERGKELMMVKEAAMARESAITNATVKPGPIEGSGNRVGMAREAVMIEGTVNSGNKGAMASQAGVTAGTMKPGPVEGSGNKGRIAREAAMTQGTVKPGSVEGSGHKDVAMNVTHH